uniref:Uncharacterized protein n=1 Tax=Anguilla anguilla TaxID=7936 RepID=A0A0E9RWB5_ANGAN
MRIKITAQLHSSVVQLGPLHHRPVHRSSHADPRDHRLNESHSYFLMLDVGRVQADGHFHFVKHAESVLFHCQCGPLFVEGETWTVLLVFVFEEHGAL